MSPDFGPDEGQTESMRSAIRRFSYSGRPLGDAEFVRALEQQTNRPLTLQKPGPRKKAHINSRQTALFFAD